jgi:HSP20 family molecular chaperone IbpA
MAEMEELTRALDLPSPASSTAGVRALAFDLMDLGDHLELQADVPGVAKEDIKVGSGRLAAASQLKSQSNLCCGCVACVWGTVKLQKGARLAQLLHGNIGQPVRATRHTDKQLHLGSCQHAHADHLVPLLALLQVTVSPNNVLSIGYERKFEKEEGTKGEGSWWLERSYGSFQRSFHLPDTVQPEGKPPFVLLPVLVLLLGRATLRWRPIPLSLLRCVHNATGIHSCLTDTSRLLPLAPCRHPGIG